MKAPRPQQNLVFIHEGKDPVYCGSDRMFLAVTNEELTQTKLSCKHTYVLSYTISSELRGPSWLTKPSGPEFPAPSLGLALPSLAVKYLRAFWLLHTHEQPCPEEKRTVSRNLFRRGRRNHSQVHGKPFLRSQEPILCHIIIPDGIMG